MTLGEDPLKLVAGPATALVVSSILWILILVVAFAFSAFLLASGVADTLPDPRYADKRTEIMIRMGIGFVLLLVNVVTLVGAWKMRRLESYSLAKAAAVLAVIPCTSACYVLGIPFGIWALMVLGRPEVRSAFRS